VAVPRLYYLFMPDESLLRLGVLTRTFGLAGGLRLSLDTEVVPQIEAPCDVRLGFSETFNRSGRLLRYEDHNGTLICFFDRVTTQQEAKELLDHALFLPESAVAYADPMAHPKLIGYRVVSEGGEELGTIDGIFKTSAHYIWGIDSGGKEWMMPAIPEFLVEIRGEERLAIVRPIPGMFTEEPDDEEQDAG
jgi:16S rRNA processing protein RimM